MSNIEIRLRGQVPDVEKAKEIIGKDFEVISASGNYGDRPPAKTVRSYLNCELKEITADADEIIKK